MAQFSYKAKQSADHTIEGVVEADNQDDAFNKLVAQHLFPILIAEASAAAAAKGKSRKAKPGGWFSHRIRTRDILLFIQKLQTLVGARVKLLAGLMIIYEQAESQGFKDVLLSIYNATKEGKAFSESLEKFPKLFPPLFTSIVKAGETSGQLDRALKQLNEYLQHQESLKTKIGVALAYPMLLLLVGLASTFVLISFVIPKLRPLFAGMDQQLPLITRFILNLSAFSNKTWYWLAAGIAGVAALLYSKKGGQVYSALTSTLKLRLPLITRDAKNQELARFASALALLLNSGVVALKSIEIATLTIEDPELKKGMTQVYRDVASGQSVSKSMENHTNLPPFFTKMVVIGEESGNLGEVLTEIVKSYNQQIEADITLISSLLEPILILGIGLILGTIVLSILLPIFQITQTVH